MPHYLPVSLCLLCPLLAVAQYAGVDDFDDGSVDPLRWAVIAPLGSGSLVEQNQNLEFDSSGIGREWHYYAWANTSYDEDFEVVFRAANTTFPEAADQFAGIGIEIYPAGSLTTRLNVRLGSYFGASFGASRDVLANFFIDETFVPGVPIQPATIFPKAAAIRIAYDSLSKVFTVFYDDNPTDGVQWTQLSTFGVDADTDGAANVDFGLSSGGQFNMYVYARTDNLDADFGQLTLDDFQLVQGRAPAPVAIVSENAAVEFTSQLGKQYAVLKSTDLAADPAFAPVDLIGSAGTYRIVPVGQGQGAALGTGGTLQILDPIITNNEKAFYKIVSQ
jgi:hypothetical protein